MLHFKLCLNFSNSISLVNFDSLPVFNSVRFSSLSLSACSAIPSIRAISYLLFAAIFASSAAVLSLSSSLSLSALDSSTAILSLSSSLSLSSLASSVAILANSIPYLFLASRAYPPFPFPALRSYPLRESLAPFIILPLLNKYSEKRSFGNTASKVWK